MYMLLMDNSFLFLDWKENISCSSSSPHTGYWIMFMFPEKLSTWGQENQVQNKQTNSPDEARDNRKTQECLKVKLRK